MVSLGRYVVVVGFSIHNQGVFLPQYNADFLPVPIMWWAASGGFAWDKPSRHHPFPPPPLCSPPSSPLLSPPPLPFPSLAFHPTIHRPTSLVIVWNEVDLFMSTGALIIFFNGTLIDILTCITSVICFLLLAFSVQSYLLQLNLIIFQENLKKKLQQLIQIILITFAAPHPNDPNVYGD